MKMMSDERSTTIFMSTIKSSHFRKSRVRANALACRQMCLAEGCREFGDSVGKVQHLRVQLVNKRLEFINRVEYFYTAGVWIVSHLEWSAHGGHPATELIFGIFKAFSYVIDWLVFLVLVRLDSGGSWLERAEFRLVTESV